MKVKDFRPLEVPIIATLLAMLLAGCSQDTAQQATTITAHPDLKRHNEQFKKEIIQVTRGIHVAVGYGLANAILIEGDDGVIIVDTLESAEAAAPVKAEFEKISAKPVRAIIYTHFHTDHIGGGQVMAGSDQPQVYCHAQTLTHLNRIASITRETTYRRAMRQFGTLLPPEELINAGIGPRLAYDQTKTLALLMPTQTFSGERREIEVAGIKMVLLHAPGETPDQIVIWLPDKKVLLPADNYYHAFPNLYAIRGTAYRDVMLWVDSLDTMRALGAEHLVPQHTRPVTGAARIRETLTNYRDAIQFVHDQTIRGMNLGWPPQTIVERVKLPAHLAAQPYLQEYYGTVEWSVRAIFDGYLGWFGGNATDLFPLAGRERARRFAALAGGEEKLLSHARTAQADGDHQWALELADQLLQLNPEDHEATAIRATALRRLGEKQTAATARNYYLTQSLETQGKVVIGMLKNTDPQVVHNIPLAAFFAGMAVHLNPEKAAGKEIVAGFRFPDTGEAFTVHVRRGVAEIAPRFPESPDLSITVASTVWKEVAAGLRNPAVALVKDMEKTGGTLNIVKFLNLFKDE